MFVSVSGTLACNAYTSNATVTFIKRRTLATRFLRVNSGFRRLICITLRSVFTDDLFIREGSISFRSLIVVVVTIAFVQICAVLFRTADLIK